MIPENGAPRAAIVLVGTRRSENIGAAARAMTNMGLSQLLLVAPEEFDQQRALTLATHTAAAVVQHARVLPDLRSALAPFGFVVGTTARLGGERQNSWTPEQMGRQLAALAGRNQVAIVFGPEDRGLTNTELRRCHALVTIPTADFSSLNLAQAVMVICYALHRAGQQAPAAHAPRLATRHELDGMYDELCEVLVRISFIQPDNPDYWMSRIRRFFTRQELRAADVRILRGICRQIRWYGEKRHRDGLDARPAAADDADIQGDPGPCD
jgi:tRNA/rRNA methyltransferase